MFGFKWLLSTFLFLGLLLNLNVGTASPVLGTGAARDAAAIQINNTSWVGFQFTTSSLQTRLQSIDIALQPTGGTANLTFRLYLDDGSGQPANNAQVLATYSTGTQAFNVYTTGNAGTFSSIIFSGALASYTLAANTGYILAVQSDNTNISINFDSGTNASALNGSGWTSSQGRIGTIDSGVNWTVLSQSDSLVYNLSAAPYSPPASIPSLGEWTQLILALMVMTLIGWHFRKHPI
jgi:hypothetical protein